MCTGTWQCLIDPETNTPKWSVVECHDAAQEPVAIQEEAFSSPEDVLTAAEQLYDDNQLETETAIEVVTSVVDVVLNGDAAVADRMVRASIHFTRIATRNAIINMYVYVNNFYVVTWKSR